MLNRAILELNGVFNVNKAPLQPSATATIEKPLQAVAKADQEYITPIITADDYKVTMENYHKAVHAYNQKVIVENNRIKNYNKKIRLALKEKPLQREEVSTLSQYYMMIAPLDIWERNQRIEEFNRCNRPIAEMEKIQTLKDPTQLVFTAILYHYSGQLQKLQSRFRELNLFIPGKLPYVDIHSGKLTKKKMSKDSEASRLNFCQRTFRRHRKRLEEAGILVDYIFSGSARPVKMKINPEILAITEAFKGQKAATDNQLLKEGRRTVLPHNKVSNRTSLNQFKIKANVNEHSDIRSSASGLTSHSFVFYKTTRQQGEKKIDTGAAKSLTLSDFLQEKIEDTEVFINNLADHRYDKYTPLRIEILEKEAFAGTLDRDQFKELVLQDFFKTAAARLYKNKTPFPGSWARAYNTWKREKFVTHSALSSNKHVVFEKLSELRYRITGAARYLKKHPEFQLLFPGDYFDTTRTTAKEGGFEYTVKMWKKHQAYQENKKVELQKTVATAKQRKRRLTDRQKVDNHVRAYLKDKIAFQELIRKVDQIGNFELSQKLPEILKKAAINFQIKNGR